VPTFARSLATSFVDVKDVAAVVELILNQRAKSTDQIYNVAFDEPIPLFDLLSTMKVHCQAPDNSIAPASTEGKSSEEILSYFPSVTRGGLDTSKVRTDLDWRPIMNWRDAVMRISKFYLDAGTAYESEQFETLRSLARDLGIHGEEKRHFLSVVDSGPSTMRPPEPDAKRRKVKDEF
jgi:hypothetical protein